MTRHACCTILILILAGSAGFMGTEWARSPGATVIAAEAEKQGPEPVDDDMHHFMEYVFEPNYKRLRTEMAKAEKDKAVWKAVKGDALTLAECANLLWMRAPEDDRDDWRRFSIAVRAEGGQLYEAARRADGDGARRAYESMLTQCNACHKQFADGKYQLRP